MFARPNHLAAVSIHVCLLCAGKTQLVKGKLAQLPEDMASLSISFNYFTDVISFQKILESPLEKKVSKAMATDPTTFTPAICSVHVCMLVTCIACNSKNA